MKLLKWIGLVLVMALTGGTVFPAQDPSVLLEKAIYTEETLGELQEAIAIYQQVVLSTEANHVTAALALYRLGICYQKSGRAEDAKMTFDKLIRLYPDQQDLISMIPGTVSALPQLHPAPWVDGEILQMQIKVKSGSQAGIYFYTVEEVQESGDFAWKLSSVSGNVGLNQYTSLRMDAATFTPSSSIQNSGYYGTFQALYAPRLVEFVTTWRGSVKKSQVPVNEAVYDYAQLAHLLRCLPLREGFQTEILVAIPENAAVFDAKLAVAAREQVTVAAGTFDCYRVVLTSGNQAKTFWISADNNSYIVKEEMSSINHELYSIRTTVKGEPFRYEDTGSGIRVEAPYGWMIGGFSMSGENIVGLFGPGAEAEGLILFVERKGDNLGETLLEEDVDKSIASEQSRYEEFAVRPGSQIFTTISGLDAIRLIADFKNIGSEKERVRYQFFARSAARKYQIRFETDKGNFEGFLPVFDSIIESFRAQ
jgi:tetratricopeptide (TPR) repeat protein